VCKVGYFADVRIDSAGLFGVLDLHGHEVFAEKTFCKTCRAAIKTGGFCDECQMGFIDGEGYFSRLCYAFAKGRKLTAGTSDTCEHIAEEGWCARCRRGRLANRVFARQDDYHDAQRWRAVLKSAARKVDQCEICAAAMIANRSCFRCRVAYRDGIVQEPRAAPAASQETGNP
jgi:hypothetical protein